MMRTWLRRAGLIAGTAAVVFAVGGVAGLVRGPAPDTVDNPAGLSAGGAERNPRSGGPASQPAPAAGTAGMDRLAAGITRAQQRLAKLPGDHVTWAALGAAYVERARIGADPTYYPKAEGALRRSLELRPAGNVPALVGLGALANARHDFAQARELGQQAVAVDPYSADAYGVLTDAYTQLGDATAATGAVQRMLDLRPGLPSYSRGSYDLELRGQVGDARTLLTRALAAAVDPADIAFCRYHLGELAWQAGDLDTAEREYTDGRAADPTSVALREGLARVAAARGRLDLARAGYAEVTARVPTPANLLAYAEVLRLAGEPATADAQLTLAGAAQQLFAANGGSDDLAGAALAIARGRPADAVPLAAAEYQRRRHPDVADLYAWSLHLVGRDAEASTIAPRSATNAAYAYHLGMIELALGDRAAARRDLAHALAVNPHFSLRDAPLAAAALSFVESQ